ncbi:hypothetical protein JK359_05960 [Streptomyces actinomycinicus]|uniref:Uncharacterized protein n=1 Tax=Streptomyces actinomycinicus TaxID=1695166 RepID=A0A937EG61_9ACTN|nr:hypothetical protein [Streptomyces actinomycinicus]MBL1081529.1 hypothetical protein [Streptomyces actinomycinicus]
MNEPVSRTMLLLDIERYSDRDDVEQTYLRRVLYNIADRALERACIDETRRLRADRGDSVMELIDANASVPALLRALLTEVPAELHGYNRLASSTAQIRLRGVVATGYVAVDERGGWVGSDLNHACRLLDAPLLRAALRERADGFALCVSEGVHAGVVRHDHHGIRAADFHEVTLTSKNGPLRAWLHGPVPHGGTNHGETGAGEAPVPGTSGDVPAPGTPAQGAPAHEAPAQTTPAHEAPAHEAPAQGAPAHEAPAHEAPAQGAPAHEAPAQGASAPGAGTGQAPGGGVVFHFGAGTPRFGGSLVAGDQHGVSGGQVTGNVHLGGTVGDQS